MTDERKPGLTLGPILFNWTSEKMLDFYGRIADEADVDRVVIGEAVCSKREPFHIEALVKITERLEAAGKRVVHTSLAMPTTKREIKAIQDLVDAGMEVEANDVATIHMLNGRPFICGPFLNIYNTDALEMFSALGASLMCLPPELPLTSIEKLAAESDKTEVFAFGRPPLAISARCYHARAHGTPKDSCQFVCDKDLDGMDVRTLNGQPFFTVNGVQTMGYVMVCATREVAALKAAGVASLRLSPHNCDMVEVIRVFRDLVAEKIDPPEGEARLKALNLPAPLSDGFLRGVPGAKTLEEVD